MPANGQADEDSWRYYEDGDQIHLYIADTDEGTDSIGSPWFDCTRSSGNIEMGSTLGDKERAAFIELIKGEKYPSVTLIPPVPNYGSLAELSFSEMYGWQYKFTIPADAQAFSEISRSGIFRFKIGDFSIETGFHVGLEKVVKFQAACRKPTSR